MAIEIFETWQEHLWAAYRADLIAAGSSAAEADENIARNRASMMPHGEPGPGQHVLTINADGAPVGQMWLAERGPGEWFVYDIEISPEHRGRGLGRAAMLAAEGFALERGGVKMGLSVFGFNTVAQELYRSLGYSVIAMGMTKNLSQQ